MCVTSIPVPTVCVTVCVCVSSIPVCTVCAEPYNPDEDEDEDDATLKIVHSKSDQQRYRLQEACKDILLFKTLEKVKLSV